MRRIFRKRSLPHNWRIKKYQLADGNVYYYVQFKSIFGYWRTLSQLVGGMESYAENIRFDSEIEAKERVRDEILANVRLLGRSVVESSTINF